MSRSYASTLSGTELDYWVARAEGLQPAMDAERQCFVVAGDGGQPIPLPKYSTDWAAGGPVIERERINPLPYCAFPFGLPWYATVYGQHRRWKEGEYGDTALIASMRAWVAYRLGDTPVEHEQEAAA